MTDEFETRPTSGTTTVRTSPTGRKAKDRRAAIIARAKANGDDVEERSDGTLIVTKQKKVK